MLADTCWITCQSSGADKPTPWREISTLDHDLEQVRAAYVAERQKLLQWQEAQVEVARARIRSREGFSTLSSDQSHKVLRPLALALTDTTSEAVAPKLTELKDPFLLGLERAEERANNLLDEILSEGKESLVVRINLSASIRNREISSLAEIEGLVEEIRNQLTPPVNAGKRLRII